MYDFLAETRNYSIVLAFIAEQFIQGHRRGLIIHNRSVWPTLFLLNVFTALKGTHLYILFEFNADEVALTTKIVAYD